MPNRMRLKAAGILAPVGLMAAVVAVGLPSSSLAASGSKVYSVSNVSLACVLAPGVLNVKGTVVVSLQGTGPTSVNPGDSVSLTNVSTTLTTPAAWSGSFLSLGATQVDGSVTSFGLDTAGGTPAEFNAGAALGSGGLPFGPVAIPGTAAAPGALNLTIPSSGTTSEPFTLQPITVTGTAGGNVVLSIDATPAWTQTGTKITSTGNGIIANATGLDSTGAVVAGPLEIDCNAPSPTVALGSIPIAAGTTTSTTTSSSSSSTTTTTSSTTTTTTTPVDSTILFKNWTLSGSLTPKSLGQTIALPAGSTFNGVADLTKGTITGDIKVPPFTANVKILGLASKVGLTFVETGPETGTVTPDATVSGNLDVAITAKTNIGITSVSLFGITIPTTCKTVSPVVFPLDADLPALDLTTGASFTGTTTLPSVNCTGALGGLLTPILTGLFSGPSNPFALKIAPTPAA